MGDFRSYVDDLTCPFKEKVFIKTLYLTAAKASELLTRTTPYQLKHNKSKPYGSSMRFEMRDYGITYDKVTKLFLIKLEVAKQARKKEMVPVFFRDGYGAHQEGHQSQADPGELVEAFSGQTEKARMRAVPIPVNIEYEPWIYDLLKWYQDKKTLSFGFTEMTAQNIVKRNLRKLDANINPRLLRRYRIIHLIRNYGFSPYQIAAFTGWSLSSMFKSIGIDVSSKECYYERHWRDYVTKLLVPLDKVVEDT